MLYLKETGCLVLGAAYSRHPLFLHRGDDIERRALIEQVNEYQSIPKMIIWILYQQELHLSNDSVIIFLG